MYISQSKYNLSTTSLTPTVNGRCICTFMADK